MNETKVLRDKEKGWIIPPLYPCYQDETKLCVLRELPDSNMQCVYDVKKGCSYSREKK